MRYAMEAGGKRLRPVLLLVSADLYPRIADPEPAAAAIEMIHTYSLVHDDLPCMDDSPLRRGKPSVHVEFGESTAVLVGDALLTEAFAVIAAGYSTQPEIGLKLIAQLSAAAGSRRLIGGQAADTTAEDRRVSAEELDFIHLNKTAALISSAFSMGLLLTDAPIQAHELLRRIGRDLGLVFQIVDDLLDATGDEAVVGKPLRKDADNKKNTYPAIHGVKASRARAQELTKQALTNAKKLQTDTDFLEALILHLEHRIA